MFKRLSTLFGAKPAKKKAAAAPRKTATAELQEAADAMGEAAAAMKRAAAEMNQAVTGAAPSIAPKTPEPPPAIADDSAAAARLAAETREELIRQAMRVRRDKARALEDLPARDRKRLRALAEKMLLGGTGADAASPPQPGTPPKRRH